MTRIRPSVLLACASDWAAPARLPRVLRRAGARVVALSAPGRPLGATRYVDRLIHAPIELDGFVEALREQVADGGHDWVLIADDPLLEALSARRSEPWVRGVLPIAGDHAWAEILGSKAGFCELGLGAGLPIPASRVCRSRKDARRAASELGTPIVLKQSSGYAGQGVRLARTADELDAAWAALDDGAPVVAQRFVDGPVGNTVFLMDHGRAICWMSAFKARTYAGPFGPSSARRFTVHADVEPLLAQVGELTGYHGFGALDWVLDGTDRLQLIELNARPVPTIHMGPLAGVDFSRAIRELLAGAPTVQPPPSPPDDGPAYPMFPEDMWRAATQRELHLREWLVPPGRGLRDVPWQDPRLLWHHVRGLYRGARARPHR